MPSPHPLLSVPSRSGERIPFGRVYTRSIRLARIHRRETFHGRQPDLAGLPAMVTSPAILVAWDFVPQASPVGRVDCGFGPAAPRAVAVRRMAQQDQPAALQPLAIQAEPRRIRDLLEPFEADIRTVRWVAVLDPASLRPDTLITWHSTVPCDAEPARGGLEATATAALITQTDIDRWTDRARSSAP
jgi:hypothetical protein